MQVLEEKEEEDDDDDHHHHHHHGRDDDDDKKELDTDGLEKGEGVEIVVLKVVLRRKRRK